MTLRLTSNRGVGKAESIAKSMFTSEPLCDIITKRGCQAKDPASCTHPNCPDGGGGVFDAEAERKKILSGEYPSRVIVGRQNKHVPGTREFEQNREKMNRLHKARYPGTKERNEPAILTASAQKLVERYKGTGKIYADSGSLFPREYVLADFIVGKTWVVSRQKYVDTNAFIILYSSTGTHVIPDNEFRLKQR